VARSAKVQLILPDGREGTIDGADVFECSDCPGHQAEFEYNGIWGMREIIYVLSPYSDYWKDIPRGRK
jgi:hypothetical protein